MPMKRAITMAGMGAIGAMSGAAVTAATATAADNASPGRRPRIDVAS
jgi:hypothetical protein